MRLKQIKTDIGDLIKKCSRDAMSAYSAQTAFFIIISFFPFLVLLIMLVGMIPGSDTEILNIVRSFLPESIEAFMIENLRQILKNVPGAVISISTVTVLWSASRGFISIIHGLNRIYGLDYSHTFLHTRVLSVLYTVGLYAVIIVTLILLGFGNKIYYVIEQYVPSWIDAAALLISIRALIVFFILLVMFLLIYCVVPRRKNKIIESLPGAVVSTAGWIGFSYLYSFYINNFADYSYLYGSLTAVFLLMLWLYFCMSIMFFGAEVNVYIMNYQEQRRQNPRQ